MEPENRMVFENGIGHTFTDFTRKRKTIAKAD